MPTQNIEQVWVDTFEGNLRHALQQKDSILSDKVEFGTVEGEKKRFDFIGLAEMVERKEKYGDTKWQDISFWNRWIGRRVFDYPYILDKFDDIKKSLTDPTSKVVQAGVMAARRRKDRVIIEAFDATAYTGDNGETAVPFDATNYEIGVQFGSAAGSPANQPFNFAKLQELKACFDESELDPDDPRFLTVSPRQIQRLLEDKRLSSADYNTVKALQAGTIKDYMSFTFVSHNKLPIANNVRFCYAWAKSCMQLGVTVDLEIEGPDKIPTKNYNLGGMVTMAMDAVRLYDAGVFRIACAE